MRIPGFTANLALESSTVSPAAGAIPAEVSLAGSCEDQCNRDFGICMGTVGVFVPFGFIKCITDRNGCLGRCPPVTIGPPPIGVGTWA